jgi:hypothetical protein
MDVARAVREDLRRLDARDELSLGVLHEQRIVLRVRRDAVQPHALTLLEADEEQADLRIDEHVPGAQVHAVPVVVWERDRLLV